MLTSYNTYAIGEDSIEGDCFMALDPLAPIVRTGLHSVVPWGEPNINDVQKMLRFLFMLGCDSVPGFLLPTSSSMDLT